MAKIDLSSLFAAQKKLDEHIQTAHHVTYESTKQKRILSLLVEIGELANETRTFKFWSLKGPSGKEIIMDEYADAMHFYLSLGIAYGSQKTVYTIKKSKKELTDQFVDVYKQICVFQKSGKVLHFEKAFGLFLDMVLTIGYKGKDITEAYFKKLEVNYQRQKDSY